MRYCLKSCGASGMIIGCRDVRQNSQLASVFAIRQLRMICYPNN